MHATAVALEGRGLLVTGRSGAGKSGLALELMARGACLVADDRTVVTREDDTLWMDAPDTLAGLIEARGLGILHAAHAPARLHAILDLDTPETERLPPIRMKTVLGVACPLLHKSASPYFPASLVQYLLCGRET